MSSVGWKGTSASFGRRGGRVAYESMLVSKSQVVLILCTSIALFAGVSGESDSAGRWMLSSHDSMPKSSARNCTMVEI